MPRVHTIGISGPSCSGKTTVTRILQKLVKHSVVIYQDDFYKPDHEIPIDRETGLANWDCPEALRFGELVDLVRYTRKHGELPENHCSHEIKNTHDGSRLLDAADFAALAKLLKTTDKEDVFVIVDGFMLYCDTDLYAEFDCRLFITASHDTLKTRRESRKGYVTADDYWVDPPGYFDKIVWPEYVRYSKSLPWVNSKSTTHLHDEIFVIDTDKHSIAEAAHAALMKLLDAMGSEPPPQQER